MTEIAVYGITARERASARSRRPCALGRAAPQYVRAELGLNDGREGGLVGRGAESRQSWQSRHFCKGKRDWFEGIQFLKVAVHSILVLTVSA